ncbi:MAG: NAD(P)/FAD-dependent oxidoreductase [Actinomycetales bacterium]
MSTVIVIGSGTAGTMVANKLRRRLPLSQWRVVVLDKTLDHVYQPGQLFVPFGRYRAQQLVRPRRRFLAAGVEFFQGEVDLVRPDERQVVLTSGDVLAYDNLVIATGATPRPDLTPGMAEAMRDGAAGDVHEFYTLDGARRLAERLRGWAGGRLVVHVAEMPIKCPVAPLEFTFLAEAFMAEKGIRDRVELTYVTPLEGAFTKPVASRRLGRLLEERGIALEPDFMVESIDGQAHQLRSFDERVIDYDLLVTVPVNTGADFVQRSGLGDELNFVPVDRGTLLCTAYESIFAIGDASNIPASKAGSVAHFSVDLFADNFIEHVAGRPMTELFDGHANCFVETGRGKGLLIDFNYDTEPLPGSYPLPVIGPFRLLVESRVNHWGKLAFRWLYWHVLLPGRRLPLPDRMSMLGKHTESSQTKPRTPERTH